MESSYGGDHRDVYNKTYLEMKVKIREEQFNRVILKEQREVRVTWTHEEPYPGTDWDNVHGFGSKRLQNHFVDRIEIN